MDCLCFVCSIRSGRRFTKADWWISCRSLLRFAAAGSASSPLGLLICSCRISWICGRRSPEESLPLPSSIATVRVYWCAWWLAYWAILRVHQSLAGFGWSWRRKDSCRICCFMLPCRTSCSWIPWNSCRRKSLPPVGRFFASFPPFLSFADIDHWHASALWYAFFHVSRL